jgi:hypothetical protein
MVHKAPRLRPQYHFRPSPQGLQAWDVRILVELAQTLVTFDHPLDQITELHEPYWHDDDTGMTCKAIADHTRLIQNADLSYPIILCHEGRLMDGMHRVCKAYLMGHTYIKAVRFTSHVPPHHVGKTPDQLPYE